MAAPPQLPDFVALNTAAAALAQDAQNIAIHQQSFAQHQQTLSQEITFIQNVGAPPHLQALTDAINRLTAQSARSEARSQNVMAYLSNSKITEANQPLSPFRALQPDPSPERNVVIGARIPGFPPTAAAVMAMNVRACRQVLTDLGEQPAGANVNELRLELRRAVGLPAF